MRTEIVSYGILLFIALSWTVESKPLKQKIPQTREEMQEFLWGLLDEMMGDPNAKPDRPFTTKQQAWFDSLGVRTPQLETKQNVRIRKEVRQLSDGEWAAYADAVNALNNLYPDPADHRSQWMLFVSGHNTQAAPAAHGGTAFITWHREYTWRLERALQTQNPDVTVPYWDTSLDSALPDPKDTVIFSEHLFGNPDGPVTTGPFGNFSILPYCREIMPGDFNGLYRNISRNDLSMRKTLLFDEDKIEESLNGTHLANFSYFGAPLEGHHGGPHFFIGGHMFNIPCTPSDPIFFSHHAFIDWVFQEFRETRQVTPLETDYPTPEEVNIGSDLHEAYADMAPFPGVYNIHGLSSHYTNYYYNYAQRHYTSCVTSADCTSQYLWCDVTQGRCVSKISAGGVCTGLTDESCYGDDYACVDDVCTQS